MQRFCFLVVVLIACVVSPSAHALADRPSAKPNIILILADDLGRECLNSYGGTYGTPRLDAFAAQGVRFTQCHALPLCTPSRVQLMTGKYNSRNYISFGALKPGEATFGHYLKKAGYATCVVGKWQLDGASNEDKTVGVSPEAAGFDDYSLWHYIKRGSRYADPMLKYKDSKLAVHMDTYGPDLQSDYALRFIEEHKCTPFFLYYPMTLVHSPFSPTPDSEDWKGDRFAETPAHFGPMVNYMDKLVGKLLDKVHALGLDDNTIIIFTGDNGTNREIRSRMADGSEIAGGKGYPIETGTHVPLLVRWGKNSPPGSTYEGLIGFEDFLPTLLDATGITPPADAVLDGQSFLPQIKGQSSERRSFQYAYYNPLVRSYPKARYARTLQYKLFDDGRYYDIKTDPLEKSPLDPSTIGDTAKATQAQLQVVLDSTP